MDPITTGLITAFIVAVVYVLYTGIKERTKGNDTPSGSGGTGSKPQAPKHPT